METWAYLDGLRVEERPVTWAYLDRLWVKERPGQDFCRYSPEGKPGNLSYILVRSDNFDRHDIFVLPYTWQPPRLTGGTWEYRG